MTDWTATIKALEDATDRDAKLDDALWTLARQHGALITTNNLTGSVDGALAFAEALLPTKLRLDLILWVGQTDRYPEASVCEEGQQGIYQTENLLGDTSAPTLPLAICLSVLRAVQAKEGGDASAP